MQGREPCIFIAFSSPQPLMLTPYLFKNHGGCTRVDIRVLEFWVMPRLRKHLEQAPIFCKLCEV